MKKHENWIDNVKVLACILVVVGHLLKSFIEADMIPNKGSCSIMIDVIYKFHVPLFFIASGYLYQNRVHLSIVGHFSNVLRKFVDLGIPYFTFSIITYTMKALAKGTVNTDIAHSLLYYFFIEPLSPYWFLMILFACFLFIPSFCSKIVAFVTIIVIIILSSMSIMGCHVNIFFITKFIVFSIWFILGMSINYWNLKRLFKKVTAVASGILFVCLYYINYQYGFGTYLDILLALFGCTFFISIFMIQDKRIKLFSIISQNFMQIFVLHTIFAAGLRIVLVKLHVVNLPVHLMLGLIISFLGPILVGIFCRKFYILDFFFHPLNTVKSVKENIRRSNEDCHDRTQKNSV